MISEHEALERILATVLPLPSRSVALTEAVGAFTAKSYVARIALPGFDNSAMDGYAVGAADRTKGSRLRVAAEQPAGADRALRVAAGETVRIFTGAPIPQGTDAVVMQEDVTRDGDFVVLNADAEPGEFIRRRACDLAEGQQILDAGQKIGATAAALLASQGFAEVEVGGEVTASVISTGDEIVGLGEEIQPGQIYDSNSVLLSTLLRKLGARVLASVSCRDERPALEAAMRQGATANAMILTGGVSVGAHDLVQECLRGLGGTIDVWRVAIKPGKPFLFGHVGGCAVFGLPGNPVSAYVTFLKFVRPALLKMSGANERARDPVRIQAKLSQDLRNDGDRVHYFRGRYHDGMFLPVGRQESHALFGLSRANALARVEPSAALAAGAMIGIELWD